MKPEMKHCVGCGAPNPLHLSACYACGRVLGQAALPPAKTYPCRACEQPIPFAAPVCLHCGLAVQPRVPSFGAVQGMAIEDATRVADALRQAAAVGSLGDWEIEPLPDGTTSLKRGFWARLTRAGATNAEEGIVALLLLAATVACFGYAYPKRGGTQPLLLVFAGGFGVCLILLLVWMVGASERLRVGPNLLERRRTLGKFQRVQRWEGAAGGTFRVSQYATSGRDGHHSYRQLRVVGKQGSATLERYEAGSLLGPSSDEAVALGRFLAQLTGWSLLGV
jgi:hypothetical protein